MSDVRVTVRVDKDLKENAENLFERLGLNMSVAFNMFLRKAVHEEGIPFAVSASSSGYAGGVSAGYVASAFNFTVQNEIRAKQQNGLPIAGYDSDAKQAYLEFADGSREYVNG